MKHLLVGFLAGFSATLVLMFVLGYLLITSGFLPARQDEPASDFEKWAAHQALKATISREAGEASNPLTADEHNLMAGVKLYGAYCSGCHGSPLSPEPSFANAYSPAAPIFLKKNLKSADSKIFWIIDHGIRFTGMPAFKQMLNEKEIWQLTLFLKNKDRLPAAVEKQWQQTK